MSKYTLIEVKGLRKYFPIYSGVILKQVGQVYAVDGISFTIKRNETLGLVGESGCGKTTTGRTILRLIEPTAGEIYFNGKNISELNKKEMRMLRKEMQMIFQDPYSSLNPRMSVFSILSEPFDIHAHFRGEDKKERIFDLLKKVGLAPYHAMRYPHEFSGGQRQRIAIARALAVEPKFVVADEPVSALDVSVRAQILNLMKTLQKDLELTYLFISHDISVVKHMSDRIAVMYLGNIVELASTREVLGEPLHPYTKALMSAVPIPDPTVESELIPLSGEIPSPINPPTGCKFHTRCPHAMLICSEEAPEFLEMDDEHFVACHLLM